MNESVIKRWDCVEVRSSVSSFYNKKYKVEETENYRRAMLLETILFNGEVGPGTWTPWDLKDSGNWIPNFVKCLEATEPTWEYKQEPLLDPRTRWTDLLEEL